MQIVSEKIVAFPNVAQFSIFSLFLAFSVKDMKKYSKIIGQINQLRNAHDKKRK